MTFELWNSLSVTHFISENSVSPAPLFVLSAFFFLTHLIFSCISLSSASQVSHYPFFLYSISFSFFLPVFLVPSFHFLCSFVFQYIYYRRLFGLVTPSLIRTETVDFKRSHQTRRLSASPSPVPIKVGCLDRHQWQNETVIGYVCRRPNRMADQLTNAPLMTVCLKLGDNMEHRSVSFMAVGNEMSWGQRKGLRHFMKLIAPPEERNIH